MEGAGDCVEQNGIDIPVSWEAYVDEEGRVTGWFTADGAVSSWYFTVPLSGSVAAGVLSATFE